MEKKGIEDYGSKPVPSELGRSWFGLGIIVVGIAVCIPSFMFGHVVASGATTGSGILAILFACIILTIIACAAGAIGASTRLSTSMTAKFTFGLYGNHIFALLLFFGTFFWFGVQLGFFAQAIGGALISVLGVEAVTQWPLIILGGFLMTLTAVYGFKAIERLSAFVVPLLFVLILVTLVNAFSEVPFAEAVGKVPTQPMPFGAIITFIAGGFAVGAVIMPDITRYAKNVGHSSGGMVMGFLIGFPIVIILAMLLSKASPAHAGQFATAMLSHNSGLWAVFALFVIVFATWTSNDNNLYSAALAVNAITPDTKKSILTIAGGALGTVLALAGILDGMIPVAMTFGVVIPPIGAVMAVDFFLFRAEDYQYEKISSLPAVNYLSIASWLIASGFGLLTNFKVFTFTGASTIDGILAAIVVHSIIMLVSGKRFKIFNTATA